MTLTEALEALSKVNYTNPDVADVVKQLFQIAIGYDESLASMFSKFFTPTAAYNYLYAFKDFKKLCDAVSHVFQHNGLYHVREDGKLEDVDVNTLLTLRANIAVEILDIEKKRLDKQSSDKKEEEDEVVWVEEDDDFLSKEKK